MIPFSSRTSYIPIGFLQHRTSPALKAESGNVRAELFCLRFEAEMFRSQVLLVALGLSVLLVRVSTAPYSDMLTETLRADLTNDKVSKCCIRS